MNRCDRQSAGLTTWNGAAGSRPPKLFVASCRALFVATMAALSGLRPSLMSTGWTVRPLQQDLYNGISGIALLTAAYLCETSAGRADPVDGVEDVCEAALRSLHMFEAKQRELREEKRIKLRPPTPGGYLGLASQIWTYLALVELGRDGGDGLERACTLVDGIPEAVENDDRYDLFSGTAGAIVPLLRLATATKEERYLRLASQLGDRLCERAQRKGDTAFWGHPHWPEGIGGFAHGVSGIGWALTKLARQSGSERHQEIAQAAFAFEEALFDETEQNWLDLRGLEGAEDGGCLVPWFRRHRARLSQSGSKSREAMDAADITARRGGDMAAGVRLESLRLSRRLRRVGTIRACDCSGRSPSGLDGRGLARTAAHQPRRSRTVLWGYPRCVRSRRYARARRYRLSTFTHAPRKQLTFAPHRGRKRLLSEQANRLDDLAGALLAS